MSRVTKIASLLDVRFPRVSGDEPNHSTPDNRREMFSPRERG